MLIRCERSPNGDDVLFISSRHIPGPRRANPSLLCHGPYSHPEDPRPDPHLIPRHTPFLSYKRGGETRGEDGGEAFSAATGTASFEEISLRLFLSDLLTELSGYPADERSTRAPGAFTYCTTVGLNTWKVPEVSECHSLPGRVIKWVVKPRQLLNLPFPHTRARKLFCKLNV